MPLEEKKSSIHLYSHKNKEELVELILKHREKDLIEDKNNDEGIAEEKRITLENAKAIKEKFALEKAKSEVEKNVIVKKKFKFEKNII